jgi:methyl-accepting chemotaxis protein WspA
MKNWNVRQQIIASFAFMTVLTIVIGALAYACLATSSREAIHLRTDSIPGLYHSQQLLAYLSENYSITQEFGTQKDLGVLDMLVAEIDQNDGAMATAQRGYSATNPLAGELEHFEAYQKALASYIGTRTSILRLTGDLANNEKIQALVRERLDPEYDAVHAFIQKLVDDNKRQADESNDAITLAVSSGERDMMIGFATLVIVALACGFLLQRAVTSPLTGIVRVMEQMRQGDFTQRVNRDDEFGAVGQALNRMADDLKMLFGQVKKSGNQVTSSVNGIAVTAREQQATATEIATTTTEIGATSREITATSRELVKTMAEVSAVAEQTATLAGSGQAALTRMEETMQQVVEAAGAINSKLTVLNEKAGNINQVVTTITKVADQTNLLSLNAAIEAEKAGEYGRGFAVVASEIRRLADQTAVATYDIEQIVKEIQSAVSAGVMGMDKFSEEVRRGRQQTQQVGGQLTQIIEQVQALTPRFEAVNEGMQAQATGAEQISHALTQLSEAARQTVESLRQSNEAIDGLNEVSSGLRSGVARFVFET